MDKIMAIGAILAIFGGLLAQREYSMCSIKYIYILGICWWGGLIIMLIGLVGNLCIK